ncbi:Uncharacterized mitochondrial protein AtMg00820 [Striga hermonthica]|uniref:Uncharacterized mitochondrial protein AtMg00820 n=1 Tax=Striga hermonthica TaxID=68872 RepID=A0A9N7RJ63_STRHE|nr:Uncharacterized mitochondrial protein AtMg00820 [Striga hermonthica]
MKCVFLRYPNGVKGYRLWLRSVLGFKVVISRDVVFNESEMPCLVASLPAPLRDESENAPNTVEQLSGLSDFDNSENMHAETEIERAVFDNQPAKIAENESVAAETKNQHFENFKNVDVHDEYVENVPENDVDLHDYQLSRDRTRRKRKKPYKFDDFHMTSYAFGVFECIDNCQPKSYEEAYKSVNSLQWMNAMREEINSLHVNHTWSLVPKPDNCSLVDCKWLYKVVYYVFAACFDTCSNFVEVQVSSLGNDESPPAPQGVCIRQSFRGHLLFCLLLIKKPIWSLSSRSLAKNASLSELGFGPATSCRIGGRGDSWKWTAAAEGGVTEPRQLTSFGKH